MQVLWVCATTSLQSNISTRNLALVLVLLRSWEPKLPLQQNPKLVVCLRNKPINYRNPYNLPLWLFRNKTTTHIDFSQQNRTYGSTMIFYIIKRYVKNKSWSLQSLVEQSLPENKVSILSKTRKGEMNQVWLKTSICILRN